MKQNIFSYPRLSPRQKTCLSLAAQGLTGRAIAHKLGISLRMVRYHQAEARAKLKAVSTTQAVHIAVRDGLLDEAD
jgi:DNA-binding CsgD family transcriptional regulator